ncbi:MAG: hypothetical protein KBF21_07595 [Thermoanaerobaculia bacterium]|nr:hypothetical protein [Thermoanaerobaculia bacterium]
MPVAAVTAVLTAGLTPLFRAATAPRTTRAAATAWANAYAAYLAAGGIPEALGRRRALAGLLEQAFTPELGGAGQAQFLAALQAFWLGMTVPAQAGVATAFLPVSTNLNSPQPATATPTQQATGVANLLSRLTLGAVKVTVPPGVIVPLL